CVRVGFVARARVLRHDRHFAALHVLQEDVIAVLRERLGYEVARLGSEHHVTSVGADGLTEYLRAGVGRVTASARVGTVHGVRVQVDDVEPAVHLDQGVTGRRCDGQHPRVPAGRAELVGRVCVQVAHVRALGGGIGARVLHRVEQGSTVGTQGSGTDGEVGVDELDRLQIVRLYVAHVDAPARSVLVEA